ncbi:MAG: type II CRISPR RNA-guided endonuclease Cas9, partial [Bdellovibrionales bacterium]|nr:type II CRISPR RNA-guided endonuclease Cas9 [Bdellovibrionales bacterium]
MGYRLGLDLGTNSIGWAIVKLDDKKNPELIINAGSRIFSDGREPDKGKPSLAVARRDARSARRRRDRLLQRKKKLFNYLIRAGFLPKDPKKLEELKSLNPYELRAKCINVKAEKYEIARALYHICQRRGFKSSRKETTEAKNKFSSAIDNLQKALSESNSRTLGEFYFKRTQDGNRIRTTVTHVSSTKIAYDFIPLRELYLKEVSLILETQKKYHPEITPEFISKVAGSDEEGTIFYQRPLKSVDVGFCQVYPKEKRAHRALPSYQKYCVEQDVFNLKIIAVNGQNIELTESQRDLIRTSLAKVQEKTRDAVKNILNLDDGFELNLQKDKYKGQRTEQLLRKDFFGKDWDSLSLSEKDEIVDAVINDDDESLKLIKIAKKFNFSEEKAKEFISLNEDYFKVKGYCHFSSKALVEALEESQKKNISPSETVKLIKEGSNPETKVTEESFLPYYGKILPDSVVKRTYTEQQLSQISFDKDELKYGKIGNPTVHVVLRQTQKVVNRIIEIYGKPEEINIEIIRDLKMSQDQKSKLVKMQNENKKKNEEYRKALEEDGLPINSTNILKLKLWNELSPDPQDRKCPYSGKQISRTKLFDADVEIEHILPFAKTLDDSFMNKTISFRSENKIKGNRSPFEAFGHDQKKYEAILERVKTLPFNKRRKFFTNAMEKFNDENTFLSRQLNDTAYIARITRKYLGALLPDGQVQVSPGKLTAFLRYNWGLDSILNKEDGNSKKNRNDHRHHAIDAIVIALSDKGILQKISKANANSTSLEKINAPEPIQNIRESVKKIIDKVITSHKPDHGIEGRFIKDSNYGVLQKKSENSFVKIKDINDIKFELIQKKEYKIIKRGDADKRDKFFFKLIRHPKDQ